MLYWKPSKKQKHNRKEPLPNFYIQELIVYWKHNKIFGDKIFHLSTNGFRRRFNKEIRQNLSPAWQEKRLAPYRDWLKTEYVLQLKGIRKSWATLQFAKQYAKWEDANVAMLFTSKRMVHSSERITATHYIQNYDVLDIPRYQELTPEQILKSNRQKRLMDWD